MPTMAAMRGAGPDEQAAHPGLEPVRIAQAGQPLPSLEERLLDRVLRGILVAEDEAGDPRHPTDVQAGELAEGSVVPALCLFHEPSVHPGPSVTTADQHRGHLLCGQADR